MILPRNLDKIILLCIKEMYLNCIEPLDLSDKTFIEVIDVINQLSRNTNTVIKQSDYDSIYNKWINSADMNLLQRDTFYIQTTRFSPKIVPNDFIIPVNN